MKSQLELSDFSGKITIGTKSEKYVGDGEAILT